MGPCATGEKPQKKNFTPLPPAPQPRKTVDNPEQQQQQKPDVLNKFSTNPSAIPRSVAYPSINDMHNPGYYKEVADFELKHQIGKKENTLPECSPKQISDILNGSHKPELPRSEYMVAIHEVNSEAQLQKQKGSFLKEYGTGSKMQTIIVSNMRNSNSSPINSDIRMNRKIQQNDEKDKRDQQVFMQEQKIYSFNDKVNNNPNQRKSSLLKPATATANTSTVNKNKNMLFESSQLDAKYYANTDVNINTESQGKTNLSKFRNTFNSNEEISQSRLNQDRVPLESTMQFGPGRNSYLFNFNVNVAS